MFLLRRKFIFPLKTGCSSYRRKKQLKKWPYFGEYVPFIVGKHQYALPGRVSDALSDGCNRLIRQGAGPATCPEDILEFFFGTGSEEERESIKKQDMGRPDENREWEDSHGVVDSEKTSSESLDRRILHLLSLEDEKHIERILEEIRKLDSPGESEKSEDSISLPELVSCLMRLKIDGRVEESSAGYYRKI